MKLSSIVVALAMPIIALGQAPAWGPALWVWNAKNATSNDPRFFRKAFTLDAEPTAANLWVTADNAYVAYVNGQKVGGDSEWNSVEKLDVLKFLKKGPNVLAIQANNQGGVAGLIARLHVQTAEKKDLFVATNRQFKLSLQKNADWLKADFDDSTWGSPVEIGEPGIAPWNLGGGSGVAKGPAPKGPFVPGDKVKVDKRQSPADQLPHFSVPEGFQVELIAGDELVINPVTMTIDEKGRIYVSESHTYRFGAGGTPVKPFRNPLVRLDPRSDGKGYERVLIADGFDDPVMGIAVKKDKLWVTANNYLYRYDIPEKGPAINKQTLVIDKNKAWNPFGMFVLEWGPDGLLYLSVGNHQIALEGPNGKAAGRGSSGIVVRMKPDGSDMERLVHGLRVPYSFEMDPFGQMWLLSNGEGNPNRFLRVIEGVDYHCYSRKAADNTWLAGDHPLAPPCFELPRGAHTQLMRYYGAAYPTAYQGSLFLDNWGAHGFGGINRAVFRFVPDDTGKIVKQESFISCSDPHFRPAHICLDLDGNMLVADWYGRDDESDLTGRIWRVKYVGKESCGGASDSLRAAEHLWSLAQTGKVDELQSGLKHSDAKVRGLALRLMQRFPPKDLGPAVKALSDADPSVRLRAALLQQDSAAIVKGLQAVLENGAADNEHLRYEAAWHFAKHAGETDFWGLLSSEKPEMRLAGLIALDVALYEGFPSKPAASVAFAKALSEPSKVEHQLLLTIAQMSEDKSLVPALEKFVERGDLPPAAMAKGLLVLKSLAAGRSLSTKAGPAFLKAIETGKVTPTSTNDHLLILELMEAQGPTPFAIKHLGTQLDSGTQTLRAAAHGLTRKFGSKAAPVADQLWAGLLKTPSKSEDALENIATLVAIEPQPRVDSWRALLEHSDPLVRLDAIRWFRNFKGNQKMLEVLKGEAAKRKGTDIDEDLGHAFSHFATTAVPPSTTLNKDELGKFAMAEMQALDANAKKDRALLGRAVFERSACTKCHTTVTQNTPLAPSLKGIGAQKLDYLVESVLYPSKIIKTGFETETLVTNGGKILSGLVKEDGKHFVVLNLNQEVRIAKSDVEERKIQKVSIMPEGQEATISRREFVDLIAYLATLK